MAPLDFPVISLTVGIWLVSLSELLVIVEAEVLPSAGLSSFRQHTLGSEPSKEQVDFCKNFILSGSGGSSARMADKLGQLLNEMQEPKVPLGVMQPSRKLFCLELVRTSLTSMYSVLVSLINLRQSPRHMTLFSTEHCTTPDEQKLRRYSLWTTAL